MPKHAMPDVIVLLPGILGSVLKDKKRVLWGFTAGSITRALVTHTRSIADGLYLKGDSPDREILDDGITATALFSDLHLIPGFWKIDGYSYVTRFLNNTFDLREGANFFQFPYDWRRDNRAAAFRLARDAGDWLTKWRANGHPDAKLLLITHSMGGLVSRYFLEVLGGWKQTRALVTFGTPFRGSVNAIDTLSNGVRLRASELYDLTRFIRSCTSM